MPKQTAFQKEKNTKTCSSCKKEFSTLNFYKNKKTSDGFAHQCKECSNDVVLKNYKQKRKERLEYKKQYYKKNKTLQLQKAKEYYKKNKTKIKVVRKEQRMQKLYKMSIQEKAAMLYSQGNCCAICKSRTFTGSDWHIDHNHKTNKVRGILCGKCNQLIGLANENILVLETAIQYLREK